MPFHDRYANDPEAFPAVAGGDPLWHLAVDEAHERAYWFVNPGGGGVDGDGTAYDDKHYTLFSTSVATDADSSAFRVEARFEDVRGGNLGGSLKVDCSGNVYLHYYYASWENYPSKVVYRRTEQRIVKFEWDGNDGKLRTGALPGNELKTNNKDYDVISWSEISPGDKSPSGICKAVGGDCDVHAFSVDIPGEIHYIYKQANGVGSRANPSIQQIRRRDLASGSDRVVYDRVYYEYEYLGQKLHALEMDLAHRRYYARRDSAERTFLDWTPCFSQPWAAFSFPRIALPFHDR